MIQRILDPEKAFNRAMRTYLGSQDSNLDSDLQRVVSYR